VLACLACGQPAGRYETAAIENRSSGGDEVISEEGPGFGTDSGPGLAAPASNRDVYHDALERAKARREKELQGVEPDGPAHERLVEELRAIEAKLRNVDVAFLQQRQAFVLAKGAVTAFVNQFAAEREWEITYAIRSGDLGLAASIVRDVISHYGAMEPARVEHIDVPQEATALDQDSDAPIQDMAKGQLLVETQGADSLLKLAQLAIESGEFGEAERQFRACLSYESDLGVRTDALTGYAALLELLERDEEARRIDRIAARTLDSAR
jgi:hypothetical protein